MASRPTRSIARSRTHRFLGGGFVFLIGSAGLQLLACNGADDVADGTPSRGGRGGAAGSSADAGAGGGAGFAEGGAGGGGPGQPAGQSGTNNGGASGAGGEGVAGSAAGGSSGSSGSAGSAGAPGPTAPPTGKGVIGYWCGPPAAFHTEARYDEIANAGFTLTSNACDGSTYNPTYNHQMLDWAKARGLTSIVADQRVLTAVSQARDGQTAELTAGLDAAVADYQDSPALAGYHVIDEPSAGLFPALAQVVGGLETRDPTRIAYLNLLPTYASTGQLGTATYDEYVASYLSIVKPQVVSWDYYPFLSSGDLPDFFRNLAIVRDHAVTAKKPFWQFVQSISFVGHRATSAAEKRWQALHSLAYGAQGIWYFTYWTPPQTAEAFGAGIIDSAGNPTAQYAEVTAINRTFAALSKYTTAATSVAVFHNGPLPNGTGPRVPKQPVYLPTFAPITVGLFATGGHRYALLVNGSYAAATTSDVIVATPANRLERFDEAASAFVPAGASDVAAGSQINVTLAAGDGLLLHYTADEKVPSTEPSGPLGAEAMVGLVRGDAGQLHVVDGAFGAGTLRGAGWNDCPTGYTLAGRDFQSNGFWLCARDDLAADTFYVGNVVGDAGSLFSVSGGTATLVGPAGWDTCPQGTVLGRRFDSNGFWLCH
jgi:hypothetical protein